MNAKYVVKRTSEVTKERGSCGYRQRLLTTDDSDKACISIVNIHEARPHYHKTTTEFYYVLKGVGTMELDGDRVALEPGAVVMIPPGVHHNAIGELELLVVGVPSLDPADFFTE